MLIVMLIVVMIVIVMLYLGDSASTQGDFLVESDFFLLLHRKTLKYTNIRTMTMVLGIF